MQRAIIFTLLLLLPTILHAGVVKWDGKPIPITISTERLTRIEFPEILRSVFLSRSDIAVEREEVLILLKNPLILICARH